MSRSIETVRSGGLRRWHVPLDIFVPACLLAAILGMCYVLPYLYPLAPPVGGSVNEANLPLLTPGHALGTDLNGNDVLSRLVHGGQISIAIAFYVNLMGLLIGGLIGSVSAYFGGLVDTVVMRVLDMVIAFPSLVLVIAIANALEPSAGNIVLALSFYSVPAFARVSRSATLKLCELPFMAAARLCGTTAWTSLLTHVAPNVLPQLVSFALLGIGLTIGLEGALGFLGVGLQPPEPTWGNMISHGQHSLFAQPRLVLLPCAALFLTILSCNFCGEALRERWSGRSTSRF